MDERSVLASVSRETGEKLQIYAAELRRWQTVTNLVGPKTLDDLWTRHIADSLQLADLAEGDNWADVGSGAGFPGLVVALARPGVRVVLIESDGRKCAFLRQVIRLTGAPAEVRDARAEIAFETLAPDVVTARAVAPLGSLLDLCRLPLLAGATALFPKGRNWAAELTEARESWRFAADVVPSRVDAEGRILRIRTFAGRTSQREADGQP